MDEKIPLKYKPFIFILTLLGKILLKLNYRTVEFAVGEYEYKAVNNEIVRVK